MTKIRLDHTLRHQVAASGQVAHKSSVQVIIYRQRNHVDKIGECVSPFGIVGFHGSRHLALIELGNGMEILSTFAQVKSYLVLARQAKGFWIEIENKIMWFGSRDWG